MSLTKNSNQNQLQQVEMRLRHVYFHRTCNTTWSTAHASCIILWSFEDIARSYVKILAYTTGTTSKHQWATWSELYPKSIVFLCIVAWHMRVFSHLPNVWGHGDAAMLSKTMKKRISTLNFEISSHQNVTAKNPIRIMYFMYIDMAWFHSLSRLEHDMLHSTVWPVHKICPMPMCWRPYPTRTKRLLFLPFLPGMLSL